MRHGTYNLNDEKHIRCQTRMRYWHGRNDNDVTNTTREIRNISIS